MSDPWVMNTQVWLNSTYGTNPQFVPVPENGLTGWPTIEGLIRALQIELGIGDLSPNFGVTTLSELTSQYGDIGLGDYPGSNVVRIIQGGAYCKGFDAGGGTLSGDFNVQTAAAVSSMRTNLGLPSSPETVTPKLFKGLLTMDAWVLVAGGSGAIREAQQALNSRYIHRSGFFLGPTDGRYGRQVNERLMFAIQYEIGLSDSQVNGNFGPATQQGIRDNGIFALGHNDSGGYWCRLFQAALRFNGYPSTPFSGVFDAPTQAQMQSFQNFIALTQTSASTFSTWASLLVSTGDVDRPATGADCITTLDAPKLTSLRNAGYEYFGRYLTNTPGPNDLDKCIKRGELARVINDGGRVWPIFQTGGEQPAHFTYERGWQVSEEAANAAWAYRIPSGTTIYFAVDFDVLDHQIDSLILPYFQGVSERINTWGLATYQVGIYAPRNVCNRVSSAGYATFSWASDMSTNFSGNKGFTLPANWSFDQIHERNIGSGTGLIRIDKNVVSGLDTGFGALSPANGLGADPLIPPARFDEFENSWFTWCHEHAESLPQQAVMVLNRPVVRTRVAHHDAYMTGLASTFSTYKALVMTQLVWESMVINVVDDSADLAVQLYYQALLAGQTPGPGTRDDSSTGCCQIFARTGIAARNFAHANGLITDGPYDETDWRDMWQIWDSLRTDEEFNLQTALFVAMKGAVERCGRPLNGLRDLTPSEVSWIYQDYNGWNSQRGMVYGREKAQLYYRIRKWHETFR